MRTLRDREVEWFVSHHLFRKELQNSRSFPYGVLHIQNRLEENWTWRRSSTWAQASLDINSLTLTQGHDPCALARCVGLIAVPGSPRMEALHMEWGPVWPFWMPRHWVLPPRFLHRTQLPEDCKLWAHLVMSSWGWRAVFSLWKQTHQQRAVTAPKCFGGTYKDSLWELVGITDALDQVL